MQKGAYSIESDIRKAVYHSRENNLDLLVCTGDLGNNTYESVGAGINNCLFRKTPFMFSPGNHDLSAASEGQEDINWYLKFYKQDSDFSYKKINNILCVSFCCNYYSDSRSAIYSTGDLVGYTSTEPSGGYTRMIPQSQITWFENLLNSESFDCCLIFIHYPPHILANSTELSDIVSNDGRSFVGFCGHVHESALKYNILDSNDDHSFFCYKSPAMKESGCFVVVEIDTDMDSIALNIHNYTSPSTNWTIHEDFNL